MTSGVPGASGGSSTSVMLMVTAMVALALHPHRSPSPSPCMRIWSSWSYVTPSFRLELPGGGMQCRRNSRSSMPYPGCKSTRRRHTSPSLACRRSRQAPCFRRPRGWLTSYRMSARARVRPDPGGDQGPSTSLFPCIVPLPLPVPGTSRILAQSLEIMSLVPSTSSGPSIQPVSGCGGHWSPGHSRYRKS